MVPLEEERDTVSACHASGIPVHVSFRHEVDDMFYRCPFKLTVALVVTSKYVTGQCQVHFYRRASDTGHAIGIPHSAH